MFLETWTRRILFILITIFALGGDFSAYAQSTAPQLNLAAPVRVETRYPVSSLGQAAPLSLASADFDGDGISDLAVGLASQSGGFIAVYRGNSAAASAPYLPDANVTALPVRPDFMAAGQFAGAGGMGVVAAQRGGTQLHVLSPDASGKLQLLQSLTLSGTITAIGSQRPQSGSYGRIAIGIHGANGPELHIFAGSATGLAEVTHFALRADVTSFAFGTLDGGATDTLMVTGGKVSILHGSTQQIDSLELPYTVAAAATGNFVSRAGSASQIALLASDGSLHILSGGGREIENYPGAAVPDGSGRLPLLFKTQVAASVGDDVMLLSSASASVLAHPRQNDGQGIMIVRSDLGADAIAAVSVPVTAQSQANVVFAKNADPAPQVEQGLKPQTGASVTTTTVLPSSASITLGDTVTLTATVATGSGTPTGQVTFFDGPTPLGNGSLSMVAGSFQASFATSLLSAAGSPHSITAVYQGDSSFNASASAASLLTVSLRPTATGLSLGGSTASTGQPITTAATVTDGAGSYPPGNPYSFTTTLPPATGRTGLTATLFADGKVLVAGGTDSAGNVLLSAEIYSRPLGAFASTGSLNTARTGAVAILLPTGKILIAGGSADGTASGALNSAELYDPVAGTFTATSHNLTAARVGGIAVLLANGKVLLAGGANSGGVLNSAELYNPATDTFTATGNLNTARSGAAATLLSNGQVLVAGGSSDGTATGALNTAELFDPAGNSGAGTFSTVASSLSDARWLPASAVLLNGKVLVAGGQGAGGALPTADIFDPAGPSFRATQSQMAVAVAGASAVSLPDGMVLLAGGASPPSMYAQLYDPDSDLFDTTGNLQHTDKGLVAAMLNDGQVLVVGLTTAATPASDAELFTPPFNPLGLVGLTSSDVTDSIAGNCVLMPSTSTASTCSSSVTPLNVDTNPHTITGAYPGDAVHSGSSNGQDLTVIGTPATATVVTSSVNPSVFGQTVSFTATVTTFGTGNPTGTVQFVVDGVSFGVPVALIAGAGNTSTATSSATSTLSVSASPHTVRANYVNTDGSFVNSSGTLSGGQIVNPAATTTTLVSSANPSTFNQSVTFTATVTDSSAGSTLVPTGAVQFVVDGVNFGTPVALTAATASSGTAISQATTNLSGAGSPHTVTANFVNADGNFSNSSGTLTGGQVMNPASTTTDVISSSNPSVFSQAVTFTATVTDTTAGSSAAPTGAVQFVVDGVNFGAPVALTGATATTSTAGSQASTTLSVSGSPHTVTANYVNADGNFANSNGTLAGGQTVTAAATATAVASSMNPSAFGAPVTFTATVTTTSTGATAPPTGSVQFVVDGVNFGSPVSLTTGATRTPAGLRAPNGTRQGGPPIATKSIGLAGASGGVSIATSQATATLSVSGSPHTVTANFVNSDGNFTNSTGSLSGGQTITPAATGTTVVSSANPAVFGAPVTFTATVTDTSAGSTAVPTGTVQFVVDGVNFGAPVAVAGISSIAATSSSQTATLAIAGSPHSVMAIYVNTDGNFSGSNGSLAGGQIVVAADTTTTVGSSLNPSAPGDSVTFTATVTPQAPGAGLPTGTVQFQVNGSSVATPSLVGGVATYTTSGLGMGSYTITANYSGDGSFNASTGNLTQVVNSPAYVLNVTVTPVDTGTVTATIAGTAFSCSTACSAVGSNLGTNVTLTATPAQNNSFLGWTGCEGGTVNGNQCTIALTGTVNIGASFTGGSTLTYTSGAIILDRNTGNYMQSVTVINNDTVATAGSVAYALDNLSSGAALLNASGTTDASAPPAGSSYIEVGAIPANSSVTVTLLFSQTGGQPISYTTRILGPGPR